MEPLNWPRRPLDVLLTVDTEVYPLRPNWRREGLREDIRRDFYGETRDGAFGLSYQLATLSAHGLKAVFFVESLSAEAVGLEPLRRVVEEIRSAGHEVQLHVHPEWLAWVGRPPYAARGPETLNDFTAEEQVQAIGLGLTHLRNAGATDVCAFRAGDFDASNLTLAALREHGIRYDSSYNPTCPTSMSGVSELAGRFQPVLVGGVWEVPISCWESRLDRGRRRHAQLTAASRLEMESALLDAWKRGWHTFVLVSHSFELLKRRRQRFDAPAADHVVVERFLSLCRFLSQHRSQFRTCGFGDLGVDSLNHSNHAQALAVPLHYTLGRWVEQAYRRLI